jgi:D-alanine-D-alanine ligase
LSTVHILVLHSRVAPDAPPDEQDTLDQAAAIADALAQRGYRVTKESFTRDESELKEMVRGCDAIFNVVESIDGSGVLAIEAPQIFDRIGARYTGAAHLALKVTGDKPLAKSRLNAAGLPTPPWSEGPDWSGIDESRRYIVKSALEDASFGLDDDSVVSGRDAIRARARDCEVRFGGRWFAEAFIEGREFNVAVLEGENGEPRVLPLAEMTFQQWQPGRVKIVGYRAKWDDDSFESTRTVRAFGLEEADPDLANELRELSNRVWKLFDLTGYVRIDFRVDNDGRPMILEINPNPCLSRDAGFAAAAERAGMSYDTLIDHILLSSLRSR